MEPLVDHRLEDRDDVAFGPHQKRLGFGVPEPGVELEDVHPVPLDHQAGVEDALVRASFGGHPLDGGNHHLVHDPAVEIGVHHRRRGVSSHPAGVEALVVVVNRLVIL